MAEARQLDADLAAFFVLSSKKKSIKRTIWAKQWLLKRRLYTHTRIYSRGITSLPGMDKFRI